MNHSDSSFDKIAWCYDLMSDLIFGKDLLKAQSSHFDCIPINAKILVIGGGSGKNLKNLFAISKPAHVTYIDASRKMLSQAQNNSKEYASKILFLHGNESLIPNQEEFDIVITNFFLDLFNLKRLQIIISKINNSLKPNALWLITDFTITGNSFFLKKKFIKLMYTFFKFIIFIDATMLQDCFKIIESKNFLKVKASNYFYGIILSVVFKKFKHMDKTSN